MEGTLLKKWNKRGLLGKILQKFRSFSIPIILGYGVNGGEVLRNKC
jgi:hypothetical protein